MDLFELLKDILPQPLSISLSIAFAVYLLLKAVQNYKTKWISTITNETISIVRVVLATFLAIYPTLSSYTLLSPISKITVSDLISIYWWGILFYVLFEICIYGFRQYLARMSRLPKEYIHGCYMAIMLCQDHDNGGFRVNNTPNAPVQLWTTAQVLHGLVKITNDVRAVTVIEKILGYYKEILPREDSLWSQTQCPIIVPSSWTLLSLLELYGNKGYREVFENRNENIRSWIVTGIDKLITFQTDSGGWASSGMEKQDTRTFPTIVSLWALTLALRNRDSLELNQQKIINLQKAISNGVGYLKLVFNDDLGLWDSNPQRGWLHKNNSLTLLTCGILMNIENSLLKCDSLEIIQTLLRDLSPWLDNKYEKISEHIDHVLNRDINDNEADGVFDDLMTNSPGKRVPITYYDWVYSAYWVLKMAKINKRYKAFRDSVREKIVVDELLEHQTRLNNWACYKIALLLVAISSDEKTTVQLGL